jgi:beta-lactamase class D
MMEICHFQKKYGYCQRCYDFEQNADYTVRSKTGWTMANQINTGWWIGYVEQRKMFISLQRDLFRTGSSTALISRAAARRLHGKFLRI